MRFLLVNRHKLVPSTGNQFSESELIHAFLKDFPVGELPIEVVSDVVEVEGDDDLLIDVHAYLRGLETGVVVTYNSLTSKFLANALCAGLGSMQLPVQVTPSSRLCWNWLNTCHNYLREQTRVPHVSLDLCCDHDVDTIEWLHNPKNMVSLRKGVLTGLEWLYEREELMNAT